MRAFILSMFTVVIVAGMWFSGCAGGIEFVGQWRDSELRVDGLLEDWGGAESLTTQNGFRIAVRNDAEFLFVALAHSPQNEAARRRVRGLTLWFDADGGTTKRNGIRYPLVPQEDPLSEPDEDRSSNQPRSRGLTLDELTAEWEWLGPVAEEIERVPKLNRHDVEVAYMRTSEGFGYELKIPLASTGRRLYAVGGRLGAVIGVGVELGGMQVNPRAERAEGARGQGRSAGRPRSGEGPPAGAPPASGPRPGGRSTSELTWFRVQLAGP